MMESVKLPKLQKVTPIEYKFKVGDTRNGHMVLKSSEKKKVLLLSDDLRMSSGVGTMSRELVHQSVHRYNFVQVGAAIKHPEKGKVFNLDQTVREYTGVEDACVTVYPYDGYGDPDLIRAMIEKEKPDIIMIFTDPRFWIWLFQMEHEIRTKIPIVYLALWDDLPDPMWNKPYYQSVDGIFAISKQSYGIHNRVLGESGKKTYQSYVPHGVNEQEFRPIDNQDSEYHEFTEYKNGIVGDAEFVVFWNNRNIRRKMASDVILAYKEFCDTLSKEKADKCVLLMKTQPVDPNGTDLPEVVKHNCPYRVVFHTDRVSPKYMNFLYNMSDITVNIASNEGFGISGAESMMTGTPIVNNVTGGLQDHCGFRLDGELLTNIDYIDIKTLHDDRVWKNSNLLSWGRWAYPVWPSQRALMGSPPTPYIFDDRCRWEDVAEGIAYWYDMSAEQRRAFGLQGREYCCDPEVGLCASEMGKRIINSIDGTLETWTRRKRFELFGGGHE